LSEIPSIFGDLWMRCFHANTSVHELILGLLNLNLQAL
jgi:hypothetical protein